MSEEDLFMTSAASNSDCFPLLDDCGSRAWGYVRGCEDPIVVYSDPLCHTELPEQSPPPLGCTGLEGGPFMLWACAVVSTPPEQSPPPPGRTRSNSATHTSLSLGLGTLSISTFFV